MTVMLNITVPHPYIARSIAVTTTDTATENDARTGAPTDESAGDHTHGYLTPTGIFGKPNVIPSSPSYCH